MKFLITLGLIVFVGSLQAQNLKESLDKIKFYVKEIQLDKSSVNQQFSYEAATPYDVKLTVTTTDSKGKSAEEIFVFNLGFFDKNFVKRTASDKMMKIEMQAAQNLKVVEHTKNGEKQNYDSEITLLANNIDDARELERFLKDAIPAAKTAWEASVKLPKDDLVQLSTWFEQHITEFGTVKQSIKKAANAKDRAVLTIEKADGKKTTENQYEWSWGDLIENNLAVNISGKEISVVAQTQNKNEFVRISENGSIKEYDKEIRFFAPTPSEAKVLAMAIQKMIPLARKELQARTPKPNSSVDGFKQLKDLVGDFSVNTSDFKQKIDATCVTNYVVNSTIKGKSKEETYGFNFGDLGTYKLNISRELIKISASTIDNKKFVSLSTNGIAQNYDNSVDFYVEDIEKARYLMAILPVISQGCKQAPKAETFDWVAQKIKNANLQGYSQELVYQEDGSKCKWKFTVSEASSKKTTETVFEFNLYDIEPKAITLDVSGKLIYVNSGTLNKEKFIKNFKEGKPGFTNELPIIMDSLEDAKKVAVTIKQLVETCKK